MGPDVQLQRSGRELVEGRSELEAVLEQRHSSKDVQTQSGSRHGNHQAPYIPVKGVGRGKITKLHNQREVAVVVGGGCEIIRGEIVCRGKNKKSK